MESKFKNMTDISSIQPERLIKYRVSEDRFSAEVLLPGLSYTDFDQKIGGKVSLWSWGKLFESIRWQGMRHGLLYYPELCHGTNHALFVASQSFSLNEDIHSIRYTKDFGIKKPFRSDVYVSHVGTSSYTVVVDLYDYNTRIKLASYITVVVFVDKATRKPMPLPLELFKGQDQHFQSFERRTIAKAATPSIPDHAYVYMVKALHSDSDMNHHVNQATYLRWCSDAAAQAALQGKLSTFRRHIELYPVKFTEFHYLGEALVNDVVSVHVWEPEHEERTLQFSVNLKGRTIFTLTMMFFDGEPANVSPHLASKL